MVPWVQPIFSLALEGQFGGGEGSLDSDFTDPPGRVISSGGSGTGGSSGIGCTGIGGIGCNGDSFLVGLPASSIRERSCKRSKQGWLCSRL